MVDGLSHVGMVVPDLKVACALYAERSGCAVDAPIDIPEQALRIGYVDLGAVRIEPLSPTGAASPIAKFLGRQPMNGLHNVALSVPDAADAAAASAEAGFEVLGVGPLCGLHGRLLFFLQSKHMLGMLLEIEELEKPQAQSAPGSNPITSTGDTDEQHCRAIL